MKTIQIAVLTVLVAAAAPARATNGMRVIGFGPVQDSMGGVGVGATLDGAAVASNPAGLTELGPRADLGVEFLDATVKYTATGTVPQTFVLQDGASLTSSRGGAPIPALSVVKPLGDDLVAAVGIFGVSGVGVEYTPNLYAGTSSTDYMLARLAPGVGYRLGEAVSVGVTLNAMFAQLRYDVAGGFGQAVHDTASSLGIGATFGLKVTPAPWVSVGLAYETKGWFQDFTYAVPERTVQGQTLPAGTDRLTLDQPQCATLGVAVTPSQALLVAADVQWIGWSGTMGQNLPRYSSDPAATGAIPFDARWSDQWVFKVGAQVSPTRKLRLRAGYNYGKMPLEPSRAFENMVFPAVAEHHVTAGLGWDASSTWTVTASAVYGFNARVTGANAALPAAGGQGIAGYSTEMSQLGFAGGVAYRF